MLIPFEKLYDYLDHQIHENTVIYRFCPADNRNISTIKEINEKSLKMSWHELRHRIVFLMHDQEPLGLDTYDSFTLADFKKIIPKDIGLVHLTEKVYDEYKHLGPLIFKILSFSIYDKILITHSELNSSKLKDYEELGAVGVYWWSHAMIARDWYRYAKIDPSLDLSDKNFALDFNVYNRAWSGTREYRLKFTDLILQNNLHHACNIKFSPICQDEHYLQHSFKNINFLPESNLEILPLNQFPATASADYSSQDYQTSAIDVVLETLFDDDRQHLTEKILRPIACGKPFILVSTAGSLEYLRNYGFKTFNGLINESYDSIIDPLQRLNAIVAEMKRITELPGSSKKELFQEMHQIATVNKKLFWSDQFANHILTEFAENYKASYQQLENFKKGHNYVEYRKNLLKWKPKWELLTKSSDQRSRNEIVALYKELHYLNKSSA